MARTPYPDPEAEKAYQDIIKKSSKPSGLNPGDDWEDDGDNYDVKIDQGSYIRSVGKK